MERRTRVPHTLSDVNSELIRVADELDDVTDKLIDADTRATNLRATADFADTAAFLGAIVLSLVNMLLKWLVNPPRDRD